MSKLFQALALVALVSLGAGSALASESAIDDFDDATGDDVRPIPEPTAALVMGAGLAAIALTLRKRR